MLWYVKEELLEGMCGVSQRGEHRSLSPGSIKLEHEVCPIPLVGLDTGFLVPCEVLLHKERRLMSASTLKGVAHGC